MCVVTAVVASLADTAILVLVLVLVLLGGGRHVSIIIVVTAIEVNDAHVAVRGHAFRVIESRPVRWC